MKNKTRIFLLTTTLFLSIPAHAEDKSKYNLFNPTPDKQLRELTTDRPDLTESPITVDAGHFQIEADIANYRYDRYKNDGNDTRSKAWNIAPVNLKAGLTNNTDLQIIIDNYVKQTESDKVAGTRERNDGFGDITMRLKHNFIGNDGGNFALGIMPFVKFPTNQNNLGNDDVEGGVIVPFSFDFGSGYGLGMMTEVDVLKDGDGSGYHPSFVNSASFAVEYTEKLGAYYEIFTEKGTDTGDRWVVSLDTGLTYALTNNLQLDAGINVGVTKAADDLNPFVGISYRY